MVFIKVVRVRQEDFDNLFKDVDKVFKQMDDVFKQVDKKMEEAFNAQQAEPRKPWEQWFAWRPVRVNGKFKWMKKVFRREIPKDYSNYDDWTRYEYGTVFDAIRDSGTNS